MVVELLQRHVRDLLVSSLPPPLPLTPSPFRRGGTRTKQNGPPGPMKHPEGRITASIGSDRLLGCSSTSTSAGGAGRNTPTSVGERRDQAQHARLRPRSARLHRRRELVLGQRHAVERDGGLPARQHVA